VRRSGQRRDEDVLAEREAAMAAFAESGGGSNSKDRKVAFGGLKPPGEIALDRMIVRTVGELARIGDADLGLRGELQIAARFDQRGVPRNRNTQYIEPCARALERKRRGRRHVAEGMLPGDRRARMSAMPFCRR